MRKQEIIRRHFLKDMETAQAKQRAEAEQAERQFKLAQYREMEKILSPFWAWRSSSI
jgi:hypothetical protein